MKRFVKKMALAFMALAMLVNPSLSLIASNPGCGNGDMTGPYYEATQCQIDWYNSVYQDLQNINQIRADVITAKNYWENQTYYYAWYDTMAQMSSYYDTMSSYHQGEVDSMWSAHQANLDLIEYGYTSHLPWDMEDMVTELSGYSGYDLKQDAYFANGVALNKLYDYTVWGSKKNEYIEESESANSAYELLCDECKECWDDQATRRADAITQLSDIYSYLYEHAYSG